MMKLGAAISGGSTKIDYMNGVFLALEERGIFNKIDLFCGTSSGAILSAVYGCKVPSEVQNILGGYKKTSDFFRFYPWSLKGLYNLGPVKKILEQHVDVTCPRDVKTVATWVDYEFKDYPIRYTDNKDTNYLESIMYSATVPVLMYYKKQKYDGGVREYMPLEYTMQNAKYVIAVASSPKDSSPERTDKKPWWLPEGAWALWQTVDEAMQQELKKCDVEHAEKDRVVIIRPSEDLGLGTFDIDPVKRKKIAEIGYNDGMKAEIPREWYL